MTPDLLNLARAVTALPGWRWMPGMQTSVEDRIVDATQCVDGRWILDTNEGTVTNARAGHEGWRRTWYDQAQEVEKNFAAVAASVRSYRRRDGRVHAGDAGRCRC